MLKQKIDEGAVWRLASFQCISMFTTTRCVTTNEQLPASSCCILPLHLRGLVCSVMHIFQISRPLGYLLLAKSSTAINRCRTKHSEDQCKVCTMFVFLSAFAQLHTTPRAVDITCRVDGTAAYTRSITAGSYTKGRYCFRSTLHLERKSTTPHVRRTATARDPNSTSTAADTHSIKEDCTKGIRELCIH